MRLRAGLTGGLLAAVLVAGVSGCGFIGAHNPSTHSSDQTGTARTLADGVQTITVIGNERMRFVPDVIKARTGRLRIVLKTTGNTPHNLQVTRLHANTGMVQKGKPGSVTVDLRRPGRYDFVCTYHVKEGMTGVIEVS